MAHTVLIDSNKLKRLREQRVLSQEGLEQACRETKDAVCPSPRLSVPNGAEHSAREPRPGLPTFSLYLSTI